MKPELSLAALSLALCLGGCALMSPVQVGMSRAEVASRLGTPAAVVPIGSGSRLQYSGQPSGQYAWMVDLDAEQRVTQARQVLTEREFTRLDSGVWSRQDVEREFGRPAAIEHVASWPGEIMTYRWNDGVDRFYWVYLDDSNTVRRSHAGYEYRDTNRD